MKKDLLLILVGLIIGVVIATSFRGCCNKPVESEVQYIDHIVNVNTDSIVYKEGPTKDTTIYRTEYIDRIIPGTNSVVIDTVYYPVYMSQYFQGFVYEDSLLKVDGNASFIADDYEPNTFKIEKLLVSYKEKQTTIIKERTFKLYAGAGVGFDKSNIKSVSVGLDLAIKQRTLIGVAFEQPLVNNIGPTYWVTAKRSLFK
jgi:hypothetical protein